MPRKVRIEREGRVDGKAVHNIFLDTGHITGCSRTLVRGDLVPEEKILEGIEWLYLDDLIIYSGSWDEHLIHLQKVLERGGLTVKLRKCQ